MKLPSPVRPSSPSANNGVSLNLQIPPGGQLKLGQVLHALISQRPSVNPNQTGIMGLINAAGAGANSGTANGNSSGLPPTAMKLNLNRPPSANKKAKASNMSMSTNQMLAMNIDKAPIRDLLNLSNALKADFDAKENKRLKLLEELELIQRLARADNAFETINKTIEDEYGGDFKAELHHNKINTEEGKHPQNGRHNKGDVSNSTGSIANESITYMREVQLDSARDDFDSDEEQSMKRPPNNYNTVNIRVNAKKDSPKKPDQKRESQNSSVAGARDTMMNNKAAMVSSKKLTFQALVGLDVSQRSASAEPPKVVGFISAIDDLFAQATAKVLQGAKGDPVIEKALETLTSNNSLLKKKRDLYESIRSANRRAAEGALYQLQLHHMRDQQVKQKVADNTLMNKELLPQFEFQEKAHNLLLNRIGDTEQKREQLHHEYTIRYKQQLLQKKMVMAQVLQERYDRLIDEENQVLAEKLKQVNLPEKTVEERIHNPLETQSQRDKKKTVLITEDTYFKCLRLSEQMLAYKQFLSFMQQRQSLSPDDLAQRKNDLYAVCDRIAKARAHEDELDEYLHMIKIRKSVQERGSKRKNRGPVGFDSGDRAGLSSGGGDDAHGHIHHKLDRRMTMAQQKQIDKRSTIKFMPNTDAILHSGGGTGGDTGTPRRPVSLNVDQTKINKLASQLIILFEQLHTTPQIEESMISEYMQIITTNKSMIMSYDEINSVNVSKHMALKVTKKEYWELRYGNVPLGESDEYVNNNPSPKREVDEKNAKWEIKNLQSILMKKDAYMATHRFRSGLFAHLHGMLFKINIIKETVGTDHFAPHDRLDAIINYYKDLWPYTIPDFLKSDFNSKIQNIFKKKFTGEDPTKTKKSSQEIVLDFNFGTIATEPMVRGKNTTSFFANPNNLTSAALLNNTQVEASFIGMSKTPNKNASNNTLTNLGQGVGGPQPRMSTKGFSSLNVGRYSISAPGNNIGRTYSQVKLLSPEEIMKKNKEIVVWDLLRQVREIARYLNEMIANIIDNDAGGNGGRMHQPSLSNNALIPELSDDTSSNNNSSTPVSRYKTQVRTGANGSRSYANKKGVAFKQGTLRRGSQSPHTSNSISGKGNIRRSVESIISVSEVSGTVGSASNTQGNTTQEQPKNQIVVLEAKAIKDLRLKEDLAELNQKYFNDKYLKFLTYNEQNTRTAETKAKNLERDPQVLNKLFIEGQVEEQFAKESYLHMKAYKEEQERLKAIDEARKAAALAQVKKMSKREKMLAATRLSLVEQSQKVAKGASTEADMVKDRLNFTKLGNFEREEFRFRTHFKKQFNSALDMLTRNDFNSLKQTITSAEQQYERARDSFAENSKRNMTNAQKLQQVKAGPPERQRRYVAIEIPKEKERPASENRAEMDENRFEPRKSTYMEPTGKIKKSLQERLQEQQDKTKKAVQVDLQRQRKKDKDMIKHSRYPFLLPPPLNLNETCAQARAQTAKGGTMMFLNISKVSGPFTPHGQGVLSQQFSPASTLQSSESHTLNNIRSAKTLQTIQQPNYKTHQSSTTAATELANMIKSSFMLGSALKTQDNNSTRNQNMQPPHFLTSINNKEVFGSVLFMNASNSDQSVVKNLEQLKNSSGTSSSLRVPNNENKRLLPPSVASVGRPESRVSFGVA